MLDNHVATQVQKMKTQQQASQQVSIATVHFLYCTLYDTLGDHAIAIQRFLRRDFATQTELLNR